MKSNKKFGGQSNIGDNLIGKEAFYKQKDMNLEDAYTFTSNVMTENMLHDDSKEGIEAFLEKREPNWKE